MERIQQKFAALGLVVSIPMPITVYTDALEHLKLHNLRTRGYHFEELFFFHVNFCSKFYLSILRTAGLRVPAWYIRDFSLFNVCFSCKNCPSASAANVVRRDVDIFGTNIIFLSISQWFFFSY
jgi:hypothetical protein